jgi:hypothetical protein
MVQRYEAGEGVATEPKHGNPAVLRGHFRVLLSSFVHLFKKAVAVSTKKTESRPWMKTIGGNRKYDVWEYQGCTGSSWLVGSWYNAHFSG